MINKLKKNKKKIAIYLVIIIIAFLIGYLPTGYYCMMPGNIISLNEMVEVNSINSNNSFNMTTVSVIKASLPVLVFGKIAPNVRVEPEGRVIPEGWTEKEYNIYSQYLMTNSHNNAKLAVANYLGIDYIEINQEPYILRVVKGGPSYGMLKSGDIIVSINDKKIDNVDDAKKTIGMHKPDEKIDIVIERNDGEIVTEQIVLGQTDEGDALLGVNIITKDKEVILQGYDINIKTGSITGPSAGAMISMELLNKIGEIEIPEGVLVAGTGTISADGKIGSIGGINQKIVTAFRKGINVYFMPKGNIDDISIDLHKYEDMEIVYVDNISQIINFRADLKNDPDSGLFFYYYRINKVLSAHKSSP